MNDESMIHDRCNNDRPTADSACLSATLLKPGGSKTDGDPAYTATLLKGDPEETSKILGPTKPHQRVRVPSRHPPRIERKDITRPKSGMSSCLAIIAHGKGQNDFECF